MTRTSSLIAILACLLQTGCFRPLKRSPLFGGEPAPQLATSLGNAAPPRRHQATPGEELLDALRRADDTTRREQLAREIVRRGPAVRADVERALNEEQVGVDLLGEILAQIDEVDSPTDEADPEEPIGLGEGRVAASTWVREKYRLALDRYLAGDIYGAIQVIEAILALEPDTALRPKLRRLRQGCRERVLRESVLRADIVVVRDLLLSAQPLRAQVALKNLSEETLTLRLSSDQWLGTLVVDYEELSPDGTRTRIRTQRPIKAGSSEIVLRAGQSLVITVPLPTPHRDLPSKLVGRYHLSGRLRAQTMLVGETSYSMFVPLAETDIVVLSPVDWPLTHGAIAGFAEAVVEAQTGTLRSRVEPARRAFVTAMLIAHEDRERALACAATALEGATGSLSQTLCAALARMTGEPLNFTRQEWLIWWKGRQSRPSKESTSSDANR